MQSYQNTVNQVPIERSQAHIDALNVAEIEALLRERYSSLPSNFSKSLIIPNLLSSSDRFSKFDEIRPRSGDFYVLNAQQSDDPQIIKNEECVDLERLLDVNLDEQVAAVSASRKATDADDFDLYNNNLNTITGNNNNNSDNNNLENAHAGSRIANPFVFNIKIDNGNNNSNNNHHHHLNKDYISDNFVSSGSNSPVNVFSMEGGSTCDEYFLLNGHIEEVSASEHALHGDFFETFDFMKVDEEKFSLDTPENSSGCPFPDFPEYKQNATIINLNNFTSNAIGAAKRLQQPALTLNLKDTFVNIDEINTPNIIDTIIDVSEHPVQFVREKEEIFNKLPFFTTSLEDFTPCPSVSPPATISDTTDSYLTASIAESSSPQSLPKRRGRPPKRRHDSDDDDEGDDETYVPPSSSRHARRKPRGVSRPVIPKKVVVYEAISEDDDENEEEEEDEEEEDCKRTTRKLIALEAAKRLAPAYEGDESPPRLLVGRRGRPPKHARSISSDDYSLLDPTEARYREMRDKNNEASRKSRYKRKEKESQLHDECELMELENLKLRAHVEELQKTVDRYRENLMEVMLHRK